ncbi:MAG TPA: hypothetical protein PLL69_07790 [Gemmatimonadales bacterium]|nr:hypothetical protein [Gemmatimonadales bacterium]
MSPVCRIEVNAQWLAVTLLGAAATVPGSLGAQQVPDSGYRPDLVPGYPAGSGPVACVDAAHHNLHTLEGGYGPFGALLRLDGWRTRSVSSGATAGGLAGCDVLVIANARPAPTGDGPPRRPTPSAFDLPEVDALVKWVENGGRLFLIADHQPLAGAAAPLAAAFGIRFTDGFAVAPHSDHADLERALGEPTWFHRRDGTLAEHPVTSGVDSVRSFTGQAIAPSDDAIPIIRFADGFVNLLPEVPWEFTSATPRQDASEWWQGSLLTRGRGRVAAWGEAAMFTAQLVGPDRIPAGMNSRGAEQNHRLLLNLMRWLVDGA